MAILVQALSYNLVFRHNQIARNENDLTEKKYKPFSQSYQAYFQYVRFGNNPDNARTRAGERMGDGRQKMDSTRNSIQSEL